MRHRKDHRKLNRTASHRRAVLRNLVTALFQYERIERIAAAEAKEKALKGEKLAKKTKAAEAEAAAAEEEKSKRGRKREEKESEVPAPAKKRTRTGVKTG